MKLSFEIIIGGNESLRKKFLDSVQNNPQLSNELINYMAQGIMWGLHLREEDEITVNGFRAREVTEEAPEEKQEESK